MQPYAATQKISARAAWRVSTTSGVIRLASTTGRPSSSALTLTGDGSSFLPRPRTASGRVMASAISFPASTSEVSEGTAKSGVPINTIRIKDVSPQPKPRRLQRKAESQVLSPSAITIQQRQIYPKTKKEPHKSSPLNKAPISEDAPPWPDGTRANRARTTQSPVLSAHISSRAQFRSKARMFEHGMICGRSAPGTVGPTPSRPVERSGPGRPGTP